MAPIQHSMTFARRRRRPRAWSGPKWISLALAVLALYGDLVKRVFPPSIALFVIYAAAGAILVAIVLSGITSGKRQTKTTLLSTFAGLLILSYVAQLVPSLFEDPGAAITMAGYVCLPLAYVFFIPRVYPEFDLKALALFTTVLMFPIHLVGLIQYFVSPSFMVSNAYSVEGGVIVRNFLAEGGTFLRYPSIFASADRFSGVAMMQIFLSFILLTGDRLPPRRILIWSLLSAAAGGVSLMIAGARSRILIVGLSLAAAAIVFLMNVLRQRLTGRAAAISFRLFLIFALILTASLSFGPVRKRLTSIPIVAMLDQTVQRGDVAARVSEGLYTSQMQEDTKIFGEGLGASGGGRPGEFGIRAMWIEGGVFWTTIMLALHAGILAWLTWLGLRASFRGYPVLTMVTFGLLLAWLFALLAGLSSTFELSQGLLLFPTMAMVSMVSLARRLRRRPVAHRTNTTAIRGLPPPRTQKQLSPHPDLSA